MWHVTCACACAGGMWHVHVHVRVACGICGMCMCMCGWHVAYVECEGDSLSSLISWFWLRNEDW